MLYYCENCVVPEIPEVEDVLVVLRVLDQVHQVNLDFCTWNHYTYVENCLQVAVAILDDLRELKSQYYASVDGGMDHREAWAAFIEKAKAMVARKVIELSPSEAVDSPGFIRAQSKVKEA